jgi:hypothetical protein
MPKSKKRTRVQYGLQKKKTTKKKTRREKRRTQKRRTGTQRALGRHRHASWRRHHVLFGGFQIKKNVYIKGILSEDEKYAIRDFEVKSKTVKSIEDIAFELTVDPNAVSMTRVIGSDSKQYLRIYCETRDEPFLILGNLSKTTFTPYEDAPGTGPYSNDFLPI